MNTTHEAKAQIKTQLADAGIEIGRSSIGGNARWVRVRLADAAERDAAVQALRTAGQNVSTLADFALDLYVTR